MTVLAAAIGAPVGTLATQVISGGGEESDTAGGRTSSVPSASDPKLEELLEHVPSEFRSTCRSVTRPPQDAPASVNCYPSFGAGFVQYRQYLDAATMASDFNAEIESMLAPDPEAERDCSDGKGKEDWEYGLMFCHVDGGGAFVEWIDVRLVIYAWAQRGDGDHEALVESWRQGAFGPNP